MTDQRQKSQGKQTNTVYPTLDAFVEEFLTKIYDRSLGHGLTWCSQWWAHAEAVFYLTALWHAWEAMRMSEEPVAMAQWTTHYLFPIMDRLMAENGPFKGCQPNDGGHRGGEHRPESAPHAGRILPVEPLPAGASTAP